MSRLGPGSRWIAVGAVLAIVGTTSFIRPAAAFDASMDMSNASDAAMSNASDAAMSNASDAAIVRELPMEQALLDATNADRAANGLPALDFDPETLDIAHQRAAGQMGPNNLSHYDADGRLAFVVMLNSAGLRYGLAGENLARSSTSGSDVVDLIEEALMKSPTHRKNILEKRFNRVAIGVATDPSSGRVAFAEIFRGD
jgi:uncharacterized protein YkwD